MFQWEHIAVEHFPKNFSAIQLQLFLSDSTMLSNKQYSLSPLYAQIIINYNFYVFLKLETGCFTRLLEAPMIYTFMKPK